MQGAYAAPETAATLEGANGDGDLQEQLERQAQLLELVDEDEAAHRLSAVREHRRRAFHQLRNGVLILTLTIFAPSFWRIIYSVSGLNDNTVWPLTDIEAMVAGVFIGANGVVKAILYVVSVAAPLLFTGWLVGYSLWYLRERDRDWRVAEALADAREPRDSAKGFMTIFRLYARTKRRATFTFLYGLLALWWSVMGLIMFADGSQGRMGDEFAAYGLLFVAILLLPLSACIVYLAYDISRRFVPGQVLVTKTLIMSMLATTSQTDYTAARAAAHELEKDLMHEKPWWFYSYKKKPKRYT